MSTPANLTYSDLETRCANALRIPVTNTTEMTKIQALINTVYRDVYSKQDWWFLVKRAVINTSESYSTDTISVTKGSTAATLLTPNSTSLAGYVLIITGDTDDFGAVYRITTDDLAGNLTLDAAFTGASNATASFNAYRDQYDCPADMGKLLKPKRFGRTSNVAPIGMMEMAQIKQNDYTVGKPSVYTVNDFATSGSPSTNRQLIVHPYPDNTYRIELFYKQQLNTELSGTTQPLMPDEYREILYYGTLARGYPIFLADTERGAFFQALFNDTLNLMAANNREYAQDRPQFAPRDDDRRRSTPRRRGRTSLGSYFDRWPSDGDF